MTRSILILLAGLGALPAAPGDPRDDPAPLELYERACSLARSGKTDAALVALGAAFAAGYDDNARPRLDPDLASLTGDPRFRELLDAHTTSAVTVLAADDEPGERIVVRGVVRSERGVPIEDALVLVHHADARGLYAPDGGPHPRLFGSMRTGSDGRYEFRTIRPASYPRSTIPQHVHYRVRAAGHREKIFELRFADDPLLVGAGRGGDEVVLPSPADADGVRAVECPVTLESLAN